MCRDRMRKGRVDHSLLSVLLNHVGLLERHKLAA